MPFFQDGGPDSQSSSSRRRHTGASKSFADAENSPLLAGPSTPVERPRADSLDIAFEAVDFRTRRGPHQLAYHSSDESCFFGFVMEKVKSTKLAHLVDKLAVESEPGLTVCILSPI
jgi:nucleobase:cation symporter-1, NCS1 family